MVYLWPLQASSTVLPTKCLWHDSDSGQVYDFYTARRGTEENPHIVGDKTARNVMKWANLVIP